jgi:hypothetical protein
MRTRLCALGLLALICGAAATADKLTDDQLLYRFAVYTMDVYIGDSMKGMDPNQLSPAVAARIFTPRLLGYSLGNLRRYAPYGSDNQPIWERLTSRVRKAMFELIELRGAQERWNADDVFRAKQGAEREFVRALEHMYDSVMEMTTGVRPDQAPDFFATLVSTPPQPPIDLSDPLIQSILEPSPPVQPPAPPVQPPSPPPPSSDDAVAGVYKVVGRIWENDPNCGSEVTLTGNMNEVEAAFKLWDRTGVTWDYKGTATWDGQSGNPDIRALKGKTQWLTYPHIWHELTINIARGGDGFWRASTINIGGNLFQLGENPVGLLVDNRSKTLTVRNTTAARVTIYLDESEYGLTTVLGSVDPGSSMKFVGIPQRGTRYLKIVPAPDTYPYMYTETLYINETQYGYFFEVLEWHLKQR